MQTIRADHWTADFQLSRACWELYQEDVRDGVHVVCLGEPDHSAGRTVLEIGEELRRYHPGVHGTLDEPMTEATLPRVPEDDLARWERAFLIVVAATWAAEGEEDGVIRVYPGEALPGGVRVPDWSRGRPPVTNAAQVGEPALGAADAADDGLVLYPDVALVPVLAAWDPEAGFRWLPESRRRKCRDAIIDGILRLYFRTGHDHTRVAARR